MISKYQMTRMPDGQFGCAPELTSFGSALNVAVLGASGGIGGALADMLERSSSVARVYRIARCRADQENRISITFDLLMKTRSRKLRVPSNRRWEGFIWLSWRRASCIGPRSFSPRRPGDP